MNRSVKLYAIILLIFTGMKHNVTTSNVEKKLLDLVDMLEQRAIDIAEQQRPKDSANVSRTNSAYNSDDDDDDLWGGGDKAETAVPDNVQVVTLPW